MDGVILRRLQDETDRRAENRNLLVRLKSEDSSLTEDPVLKRWEAESQPLPQPLPLEGDSLPVRRVMGDPAHIKARIAFAASEPVKRILGAIIKLAPEDRYGYDRAFYLHPQPPPRPLTVLDPTSGGGSIPFEAMRLGHKTIANELNPVAAVILYATLDYPARFGKSLVADIEKWGKLLLAHVEEQMEGLAPFSMIPESERQRLREHLKNCPEFLPQFDIPEYDHTGQIFVRQAICPHCGGEAPLLNTCWLSKEAGDTWGVEVIPDGRERNGKVKFAAYRVVKGRGPDGENPEKATVNRGVGQCLHCRQAIDGDEIKAQARGESQHGRWTDRLYAIVAVRLEPVLDKHGQPVRYKSGDRKGEIKTRKVRFFRPPNDQDLAALAAAEKRLQEKWPVLEAAEMIPTERIPDGEKTKEPLRYGMTRWCDMFTPRQLLGHLTLIEGLNTLKPQILAELGTERGRAVVTYLQFAIDKGLDYNSRQTRWHYGRGVIVNTFGRQVSPAVREGRGRGGDPS
ncbi:MAG: hypothetical protein WCK00_01305 [Deltaproteobacteria bacterium]